MVRKLIAALPTVELLGRLSTTASASRNWTRLLQGRFSSSRTTTVRKLILALTVAVLLGSGIYWYARSAPAGTTSGLFEVRRGDLIVKITERGEVRASEFVTILSRKT